jgi:hypothetical protein
MIEQFDKTILAEQVRKIRDEQSLSLNEIAIDLDMTYMAIKRLMDPDCSSPIRALTVRKIKAFINKYNSANTL